MSELIRVKVVDMFCNAEHKLNSEAIDETLTFGVFFTILYTGEGYHIAQQCGESCKSIEHGAMLSVRVGDTFHVMDAEGVGAWTFCVKKVSTNTKITFEAEPLTSDKNANFTATFLCEGDPSKVAFDLHENIFK